MFKTKVKKEKLTFKNGKPARETQTGCELKIRGEKDGTTQRYSR